LRVWRVCKRRHAAFDGEGARLAGGRWNRPGTAVVYTSATLSLAVQELFVHLSSEEAPGDLVAVSAEIPGDVRVMSLRRADLPRNWRAFPAPESLAELGARWLAAMESAVLEVPSAVIPQENNYLLNPAHSDFRKIRPNELESFAFDSRMWEKRRG
jgi:RES domain-containing protein